MININPKSDVVIISGATASGKSDFATNIALKAKQAVIINADSAQVYSSAPILSNIPTLEEQQGIPHKLFAVQPITDYFSVAMWLELVKERVEQAKQKSLLPIIVGGSAMYIFSLIEGLSEIPSSLEARNESEKFYNQLGHLEFLQLLSKIDPDFTKTFQDKQRIIRAYEVFLCSGNTFTYWQLQPRKKVLSTNFIHLYINKQRELLYHDIDSRFDKMIKKGALEEVEKILTYTDSPNHLKKILGLYDLSLYLHNKIPLEEAVLTCKKKSKNYAKRQITFLQNKLKYKIIVEIKNNISNMPINILD